MIFKIKRIDANEHSTVSEMEINGKTYFILEDTIRNIADKIYGETAIPYGKYKLSLVKYGSLHNWLSNKFKSDYKGVIMLNGVKGFTGVCYHPGATVKNTLGCLPSGRVPLSFTAMASMRTGSGVSFRALAIVAHVSGRSGLR